MHLNRSMGVLITLAIALAGCSQSGDQGSPDPLASAPQAPDQYVLTVEGMV